MAEQKSSSILTAPLHGAASVLRRVPGAGLVGRAAQGTLEKVGAVSPRGRRIAVYTGAGVLGVAGVVEWPVALTGAAVAWLTQPRPDHPERAGQPPQALGTAPDGGLETGEAMPVSEPAARNVARPTGTTAAARQAARKRAAATREGAEDIGTAALRSPGTRSRTRPSAGRTSAAKPATAKAAATAKAPTGGTATSKASTRKAATAKAATTRSATTSATSKATRTRKTAAGKAATAKAATGKATTAKASSSRSTTGTLGPTARRARTTG
ncbi:hypothetical protein [Streptomyces spiralis]|uniref:hypothetical protein n=1 Tax=Streptomyces spiralis TaxID=66376 RepID=UPI003F4CE126